MTKRALADAASKAGARSAATETRMLGMVGASPRNGVSKEVRRRKVESGSEEESKHKCQEITVGCRAEGRKHSTEYGVR
jgi:hypothetical protein